MISSGRNSCVFLWLALAGLLHAQAPVTGAAPASTGLWAALVLIVGLVGGTLLIYSSIKDGRSAKATIQWPSVPGTVVFSQMVQDRSTDPVTSSPVVQYTYIVQGQALLGTKVTFGSIVSWAGPKIVAKYPKGKAVEVFFNPQQPSSAVLEKGGSTKVAMAAGVGILLFCVVVGAIMVAR